MGELYEKFSHLSMPEQVFEHLWHIYDRYYALFEAKEIDWQQSYHQFRSQVRSTTTEEELIQIFANMLNPLKDGHVRLIKDSKNAIQLDRRPCLFSQKFKGKFRTFYANTQHSLEEAGFGKMNAVYRIYDYEDWGFDYLYYYVYSYYRLSLVFFNKI